VRISRLLTEAGFSPSKDLNEPLDYIGVELDIMRLLCSSEDEAWRMGGLRMRGIYGILREGY
jgi:TorA maturation chaperone TorD